MKDSNDINVVQIRSKGSGEDIFNVSTKNFCDSYKIENNPDYAEVLSIMHKKRKFVVRVKEVDGSI
jgi:CRISPR/Cas system-associated protein Csx1